MNKTEKLLRTGDNWESHVAQQILLPRTSSPTQTDKQLGTLEQLEVDTEDDLDIRDFSERPANDMKSPKLPRKTKACILDLIPPSRVPRLHGNEPHSYGNPQAPTARDQKPTDREEEVPNWMACLFEEVPSQSSLQQ